MNLKFFYELAGHRRLVEKNKNLFQLFYAAFDVTDNSNRISFLQKEFVITELLFSYSHFGFGLFSSLSSSLIQKGLHFICDIEKNFVENYLFHLKKYIEDEIQIENKGNYFSEECLESSFSKEFIKRIFSNEPEEDIHTGMIVFCQNTVARLRNLSRSKISQESIQAENYIEIETYFDEIDLFQSETLKADFILFLKDIKYDPLILIVRRFESFMRLFSDGQKKCDPIFIFKQNDISKENRAKKMAALLVLFLPHESKSGQKLFKNSMRSLQEMNQIFSHQGKSDAFYLGAIKNWLDIQKETELKSVFETLLTEAVESGIIFKVPRGKVQFNYGLTESGMKIIQPYVSVLQESLMV